MRSAAAMSGRRSSSWEGMPGGDRRRRFPGASRTGMEKPEGTRPTSTAMACSYWARLTPRLVSVASAFWRVLVASTIAILSVMPVSYWARVKSSARRYASTVSRYRATSASWPRISKRYMARLDLFAQLHVRQVGGGELRVVLRRAHGLADATPQVGFPGDVDGGEDGGRRARCGAADRANDAGAAARAGGAGAESPCRCRCPCRCRWSPYPCRCCPRRRRCRPGHRWHPRDRVTERLPVTVG